MLNGAMKMSLLSLPRWCVVWVVLPLVFAACNGSDPGLLSVSTGALDVSLGGQSFTVSNAGPVGSTLAWRLTISQNANNPVTGDWFSVSSNQGNLATGESDAVVIVPDSELEPGTYNATITVIAGTESRRVQVTASRLVSATSCVAEMPVSGSSRRLGRTSPEQEILVRYRDGVTSGVTKRLESRYDFKTVAFGAGIVPDVITVKGDVDAAIARLERDPDVLYAVPNETLELQQSSQPIPQPIPQQIPMNAVIPNDALYPEQWHVRDFGIPQAWAIETGKQHVTVAIIDSSVDTNHEDLTNALLPGCDLFDRDDDPNPGAFDPDGFNTRPTHGTHTAGVVAATGNNGVGVAGVAFGGVRVLPVKVFNDAGVGAQVDDLINGIRWSVGLAVPGFNPNPYPAQILNLSLGTRGENAAINEAVADAVGAGALVIAAAGNQGLSSEVLTPANAEGALSVGSVDSDYLRSSFSNYNRNEPQVDIMAPGGVLVGSTRSFCDIGNEAAILSTFADDNYGCLSGTSMSAPFVAGVAALVWSQNPTLSAAEVTTRLLTSTRYEDDWDPLQYGAGVLCADRALGATTLCGQ